MRHENHVINLGRHGFNVSMINLEKYGNLYAEQKKQNDLLNECSLNPLFLKEKNS